MATRTRIPYWVFVFWLIASEVGLTWSSLMAVCIHTDAVNGTIPLIAWALSHKAIAVPSLLLLAAASACSTVAVFVCVRKSAQEEES